ncbi:ROK family protein [Jatrophihabitans telluris]|uniref:ROK family protein n=1 Tax=Jatrophihabitans telluris TaxID=2038343 RepID=A0ABY4QWT2_9ACTN|nr:ROK family protein [Jatrophihabitans telluris]UQX87622.1 ROK family protein [Jatrophihabitans telluris]
MNRSRAALEPYPMTDSARAVFRRLSSVGPTTRPVLSQQLNLSRPTMSAAMAELASHGLVLSNGESRGHTGRSAALYSLAPEAGHVLVVELGASRVRVESHSLDFTLIASAEQRLSSYRRTVTPSMVTKAAQLIDEVVASTGFGHGPLRDVVIVTPTLPSELHAPGRRPEGVGQLAEAFELPPEVPYLVENNVNCAALAEHRAGAALGVENFLYLQVGVKIGAGIVIKGELHAGAHGAAGEVALLPFPWSPGTPPRRLALEHYLGSDELMKRCRSRWSDSSQPVPRTAAALYELAAGGHPLAGELVAEHAENVGMLAAAVISIVDPEVVVLGGGVGQNELMLREVRATAARLAWDTDIRTGALGNRASIVGAVHLAVARTLTRLA